MAFRSVPPELFGVEGFVAKTAGIVDLPPKVPMPIKTCYADRGSVMLMLALREALAQSGRSTMEGIDAVIIGTSAGAMSLGETYFETAVSDPGRHRRQLSRAEHYQPQRQMNEIAAELGWRGPIIIVSNACASGANAIGWGVEMIRSGRAKRVLAGGYDALAVGRVPHLPGLEGLDHAVRFGHAADPTVALDAHAMPFETPRRRARILGGGRPRARAGTRLPFG